MKCVNCKMYDRYEGCYADNPGEDSNKRSIKMDLSNFSYSHIYWIFLLPLIGAGADIANAVWERIAGKVL